MSDVSESRHLGGFTIRSILLGIGMVLIVCLGAPLSIWIVGSTEITWSFFPIGVGLPFILVVFANAGLKRIRRSAALRPAEMMNVVVMGLVGSGIPVFIVGLMLSIPTKPYYGATPENDWVSLIQPHLPDWAIPSPEAGAMRYFYEGLPDGGVIPWGAWWGPLAWWLSLVLAIYFLSFCLVVILRRQWMEHERLLYPLMQPSLALIEMTTPVLIQARLIYLTQPRVRNYSS